MQPDVHKGDVFFIHARPVMGEHWSPTRGATFAIKRTKMGLYKMGLALCGKKDHFNKAVGRTISSARLEKEPWHKSKRLGTVINSIFEVCQQQEFVLPVNSIIYLQDKLSNGKGHKG